MKAVRIEAHGGLDALKIVDLPVHDPGPGEVRVRIEAAGLNHLDLWVRGGVPGHKFPLPITPGCDGAGVIDAVGPGVGLWKSGDKIVLSPGEGCGHCRECRLDRENLCRSYGILGETEDGTCAEFVTVKAGRAFPMPANLSFEETAAVPLVFLTAWHMVVTLGETAPGETVLIHAAGSGVSSAAIQIAKLWGAKVLTTAGSPEKCRKALELGADEAIPYREKDFYGEVRRITGKRGVDLVVDHVGGDTMARSVRCLVKGGRLLTCGTTSGSEIALDFRHVFFKSLKILGSTMGGRGELSTILEHVGQGRLKPVIDSRFPLDQVREAHARLEDRSVFGKILLIP